MTEDQTQYISEEKRAALLREYADLKEQIIPGLAKRIDDARQMGDLSENAEYHAAREEMSWAQSRVKELERIVNYSQIIHAQKGDTVGIGSSLTVEINGQKRTFTIVGAQEADPVGGKISNESPLGQAFLGKRKGSKVEVAVPAGIQVYSVLEVV